MPTAHFHLTQKEQPLAAPSNVTGWLLFFLASSHVTILTQNFVVLCTDFFKSPQSLENTGLARFFVCTVLIFLCTITAQILIIVSVFFSSSVSFALAAHMLPGSPFPSSSSSCPSRPSCKTIRDMPAHFLKSFPE